MANYGNNKLGSGFLALGADANNGWGLGATQFGVEQGSAGLGGPMVGGPSFGGVLGLIEARKQMRLDAAEDREERVLQMAEETQSWKRYDVERQIMIQNGMTQAAQDGGFEGVMAYLSKADPERALEFGKAKERLDADIMSNEVMREIAIPAMREEALIQSYRELGKFGSMLMQSKPEDRSEIYDSLLPALKVINPNMPDNLRDAVPQFMLAISASTPQSIAFKNTQTAATARTQYAKLHADYTDALANGEDPSSDYMKGLKLQIETLDNTARGAQIDALKAQIQMQNQQTSASSRIFNNTMNVTKQIASDSKQFNTAVPYYQKVKQNIDILRKNPNNGTAGGALVSQLVRFNGEGANASDKDMERYFSATGVPGVMKKIRSVQNGYVEKFDPTELDYISTYIDENMNSMLQLQQQKENMWQQKMTQDPNMPLNWEGVILPSQQLSKSMSKQNDISTVMSGQIPIDLQAAYEKALLPKEQGGRGMKPEQARAILDQAMQHLNTQGQQQTQDNLQVNPLDYAPTPDADQQLINQIMQNQMMIEANEKALGNIP